MFERRLRGYRAIGYARGEVSLGPDAANEDVVVGNEECGLDEDDLLDFSS